jgi:MFS family permease
MAAWLARLLGVASLRRVGEVDDRGTVLALFARLTDELASGLLVVLMPTFRTRLGLPVVQVGWLWQVLFSTAAVVEPIAGAAIDVVRRRPLLVWGALGWGAALLLAAGAPSFGWLLAAFALVGAASGPLAHTADVVLVDGHPDAVERITGRSTTLTPSARCSHRSQSPAPPHHSGWCARTRGGSSVTARHGCG